MGPRLERLSRRAETSLQSHHLKGNVLRLAYRPDAASEVKAVVAPERDCCQFSTSTCRKALPGST